MFNLNPQQQQWYQKFLEQRQASLQQQLQTLHGLQPWGEPGFSRFNNPLIGQGAEQSVDRITDMSPVMMGYFMGGGGEGVSSPMNPMLMQMLLTGSTGFGGM